MTFRADQDWAVFVETADDEKLLGPMGRDTAEEIAERELRNGAVRAVAMPLDDWE